MIIYYKLWGGACASLTHPTRCRRLGIWFLRLQLGWDFRKFSWLKM